MAALASWLDARAHEGQWLVRIEDVDGPRCVPGADQLILGQLARCGLEPDEAPVWQSQRSALYEQALHALIENGHAYGCACTRKQIADAAGPRSRNGELVYPGTCRAGTAGREPRAWRLRTDNELLDWTDRRLGPQSQRLESEVGDFVLKRADGLWAYQLAVVADDAAQGITDVVRGQDLADNTPRQILLQRLLGLPTPRYLHTPLVLGANGEKLSKQNGAAPLDLAEPASALREAAAVLGLTLHSTPLPAMLSEAVAAWRGMMPPLILENPP